MMIKYALYIFSPENNKFCFYDTVLYQAKIIENEELRINLQKLKVVKVEHDLDANVIDLYLEKI